MLFDTTINAVTKSKNYKIINSRVYSVTKLDIGFQQEMPGGN